MAKHKQKKSADYPLFLELPLNNEQMGKKTLEIKESIKKSIGIDLL